MRLEDELEGKRIIRIGRAGKYLRFELSGNRILWFHLGMTGQLLLGGPSSALGSHTHFVVSFIRSEKRLFFRDVRRFGRIALTSLREDQCPKGVRSLGLEPRQWDREAFASLFKMRRARIKNLLLNQKVVAGLGNIYADESLHRAGIHPLRRPHQIPRWRLLRLHEAICEILEEAVRWGGSSIDDYVHWDGTQGRFQQFHRVYGREGKGCGTCGTAVRRLRLSGRASSFCPRCQSYQENRCFYPRRFS